jgi:hypothetical protein
MKMKLGNIGSLQLFQLLRFSAVFLISIFLSKSSLSTAQIGQYEVFIFLAGIVSFFWISGFTNSFLSLFPTYPDREKNPLFFNAFLLMTGFSMLAAIAILLASKPISVELGVASNEGMFWQLLLYLLLSGPISLLEIFYLLKNQSGKLVKYGVFTVLIQLTLMGIPILLSQDMDIILLGLNASVFVRLLWLVGFLFRHAEFRILRE